MSEVTFFVPGTPAPQGSKKYVGHRAGKPVLLESSAKVRPWRAVVAQVAALKCHGIDDGPVAVEVRFVLPRPKSLPKRVTHMVRKPDLDKLIRSTLDALSGVAYPDDNRVTTIHASKRYATDGEQTGATIRVELVETPTPAPAPATVDRDPATTKLAAQELDDICGDPPEHLRWMVRMLVADPHTGCSDHHPHQSGCEWCTKFCEAAVALRCRYFARQGRR